ncbi:MAG: hypothetical protein ACKO96_05060 [Flammeovirgaceae bacterium]
MEILRQLSETDKVYLRAMKMSRKERKKTKITLALPEKLPSMVKVNGEYVQPNAQGIYYLPKGSFFASSDAGVLCLDVVDDV